MLHPAAPEIQRGRVRSFSAAIPRGADTFATTNSHHCPHETVTHSIDNVRVAAAAYINLIFCVRMVGGPSEDSFATMRPGLAA